MAELVVSIILSILIVFGILAYIGRPRCDFCGDKFRLEGQELIETDQYVSFEDDSKLCPSCYHELIETKNWYRGSRS